jgi:membrane protease YdiL (CAAX protease family)
VATGTAWLGYIPLLAGFRSPFWQLLLLLPAVSPAFAARVAAVPGELKSLWKIPSLGWILLAGLVPGLLLLLANGRPSPPHLPSLTALLFALTANVWEEIGWRGFAQRRLQSAVGMPSAALLVGLLWGLWHMPLFFLPQSSFLSMANVPFAAWLAALLAESLILAWIFHASAFNLPVAVLFHIAMNLWSNALNFSSFSRLAAVEWVAALSLYLASRMYSHKDSHSI